VTIELGRYRFGARRSTIRTLAIGARCAVLGWSFLAADMWSFFIPTASTSGPGFYSDLQRLVWTLSFLIGSLFFLLFAMSCLWAAHALAEVASHPVGMQADLPLVRRWRAHIKPPLGLALVGTGVLICIPLLHLFVLRRIINPVVGLLVAGILSVIMLIHGWVAMRAAGKARADADSNPADRYKYFDWTAISLSDKERFRRLYGHDWKHPEEIVHRAEAEQYRAEASDKRYSLLAFSFVLAVLVAAVIQPVLYAQLKSYWSDAVVHAGTDSSFPLLQLVGLVPLFSAAVLVPGIQMRSSRYSKLERLYEDRSTALRELTARKRINGARDSVSRHVCAPSLRPSITRVQPVTASQIRPAP
jgi:hypothetical protein